MTWKIMKAWLSITLKSFLYGEVLIGWFLLSKEPVKTWLPFPRCLDESCPDRRVYLIHTWAWLLKKLAKEPSTWIECREDCLMTDVIARAKTAPLAIARAFLKASGVTHVEVPDEKMVESKTVG